MKNAWKFSVKWKNSSASLKATSALFALLLALIGCRVQAGNPQTEKPKNPGTVTVALADAPVDELSSVYVVVQGVAFAAAGSGRCLKDPRFGCADSELFHFDFSEEIEVDLLTLSGGKTQALPFSQELSAGTYEGIRLFLSPEKPVRGILKEGGAEVNIDFAPSPFGRREFTIQEEFDVEEGIENQILIHVDLRRSLKKRADGGFVLLPFVHVVPSRLAAALHGKVPDGVTRVCAYPVDGIRRPGHRAVSLNQPVPPVPSAPLMPPMPLDADSKSPFAQRRPSDLRLPPLFDSMNRDRIPGQPDETDSCDNAEAVSEIADGQYELFHLPPVRYVLRAFRQDGSYFDLQTAEPLLPQERRRVDL